MRQRLLQQQQAEQHPEPHGESGRSAGLRRGRRGGGFGGGRSPPVQGAGASATGCPQRAAKGSSLREGERVARRVAHLCHVRLAPTAGCLRPAES